MATQYATTTDLANVLSGNVLTSFTAGQQNAALLAASELFDSRAREHFTLPLVTTGQDVVDAVCAVAAYRLMRLRGYNPEAGGDIAVKEAYDYAMKWMDRVANGSITPDVTDSSQGGIVGGAFVGSSSQRGWSNRGNSALDPGSPYDGD